MNHIKILSCGLLIGLGLSIAAPQCHAGYVNDEAASVVTFDDGATENFDQYTVLEQALASPDGTLSGQREYTVNGHRTPSSKAKIGSRIINASATSEWYWAGGGTPSVLNLSWVPGYTGGVGYGGPGMYGVSASITGSQTGLTRRDPNSVDDWVLDSSGGVNYSFASGGTITGDGADFGTTDGDQRSYPCGPAQSFTLTTSLSLTSSLEASGLGSTNLNEIATLYVGVDEGV